MADITMCSNKECPKLESVNACWRANCPPNRFWQSYQEFIPEKNNDDEFECSMFLEYPEIK
jgi:hypothetical protein